MKGANLELFLAKKRVFFVTLFHLEYIRIKQELSILNRCADAIHVLCDAPGDKVLPLSLKTIFRVNWRLLLSRTKSYDLFFISGLPQLIVPFILFKPEKLVVIDFFISLYDTMVLDRKVVSAQSLLAKILKWLDKRAISRADLVIVDTEAHGNYLLNLLKEPVSKMAVLYLEADKETYHDRAIARPENLNNKYVVFFFGAMNPLQGVENILECAKRLSENSEVLFVLVGPYDKIPTFSKYKDLPNVLYAAKWLTQPEIADYIAMSDLCLAGHFNADIQKAKSVIPGKAYIYLAMNKPVILGENPANRECFSEANPNVHFVKMGDPEALKNKILHLYKRSCDE